MKMKNSDSLLMIAYFFLATGIIAFFSALLTFIVCAFIGFQPIRADGLSELFVMTYIPIGWALFSLVVFAVLFFKSKRNNNSDQKRIIR